jgi:hypothetical protein
MRLPRIVFDRARSPDTRCKKRLGDFKEARHSFQPGFHAAGASLRHRHHRDFGGHALARVREGVESRSEAIAYGGGNGRFIVGDR